MRRRNSIRRAKKIAYRYLKRSRYLHSLSVAQMALQLQDIWGGDREILIKAALLHDVGYAFGGNALSHADISAKRASMLGYEEEVISVIGCHTVGKRGMNLEEKILFLADGIEERREYEGVEELRALARVDLTEALLAYLASTRKYLEGQGKSLHQNSLQMIEELEMEKEWKNA